MAGETIKQWLKDNDMRPEELASRLKISMGTLNNFFAGKNCHYPLIIALSHVTGIDEQVLSDNKRKAQAS